MAPTAEVTNAEFSTEHMTDSQLYWSLMSHISHKGFQAGAVLGSAVLVPALLILKRAAATPSMLTAAVGYSALGLTTLSTAGGLYRCSTIDRPGFEDRVYRLHYNEGQNRTDQFSSVGVLAGMGLVTLFFRRRGIDLQPMNMFGGAAGGSAAGIALHLLSSPPKQTKEGAVNSINVLKYEATPGTSGK